MNPSDNLRPGPDPIISVIIPTFNEEKLILSTLSQFTPELRKSSYLEIIVSDGGSTDGTVQIINGIPDKILTEEPGGTRNISIGRNRGASAARGRYLYFINADTRIENTDEFFNRTRDELVSPKVAALTCNIRVFPEEEKLSDKIFHTLYNKYVSLLNSIGMGMGRGECQMVKKDLFAACGGYNESMPAGEDYDLYRRLRKFGKIRFIKDLTVYESPRRYRKYGYIKVFWEWTRNSLSVFFRNRAVSKEWEPVR